MRTLSPSLFVLFLIGGLLAGCAETVRLADATDDGGARRFSDGPKPADGSEAPADEDDSNENAGSDPPSEPDASDMELAIDAAIESPEVSESDAGTPPRESPPELSAALSQSCELLCEKVTGCQAQSPRSNPCDWVIEDDLAYCRSACATDIAKSPLRQRCVTCLASNLGCGGTAPVRPCDDSCGPTAYATGRDYESAYQYNFVRYYCDEGFDPSERPAPIGSTTEAGKRCALLCEMIVGCREREEHEEHEPACEWIAERDLAHCQASCEADTAGSALREVCVECLTQNLRCEGWSHECDSSCSPTPYRSSWSSTYPFWTYYCDLGYPDPNPDAGLDD
jgi:hypothetical protein